MKKIFELKIYRHLNALHKYSTIPLLNANYIKAPIKAKTSCMIFQMILYLALVTGRIFLPRRIGLDFVLNLGCWNVASDPSCTNDFH